MRIRIKAFEGKFKGISSVKKENEQENNKEDFLNEEMVSGYLLYQETDREEGEINKSPFVHPSRVENSMAILDSHFFQDAQWYAHLRRKRPQYFY